MAGEEWARRIVELELGQPVVLNDNGSSPSMYDLRVGLADSPEMAIEVVGAVDERATETWNIGPAEGPIRLSLVGDWMVIITPESRVRAVKQSIESILQSLEARRIWEVRPDFRLRRSDKALFVSLAGLCIEHVFRLKAEGMGDVHFSMPGMSGVVDGSGTQVPRWVSDFLRQPKLQDVIQKLNSTKAPTKDVFIIASFFGTDDAVALYLMSEFDKLPSEAPDLPAPITGVWLTSSFGEKGIRWNGATWSFFRARGPGIEMEIKG